MSITRTIKPHGSSDSGCVATPYGDRLHVSIIESYETYRSGDWVHVKVLLRSDDPRIAGSYPLCKVPTEQEAQDILDRFRADVERVRDN